MFSGLSEYYFIFRTDDFLQDSGIPYTHLRDKTFIHSLKSLKMCKSK